MSRLTDAVRHLLLLNVLVFFGSQILLRGAAIPTLAMYFPGIDYSQIYSDAVGFRPYQLVSHMFMHGGLTHLFFNMFALYMFGPPLEARWGTPQFLFFYLSCGFGALALHMGVAWYELNYMGVPPAPVLGASGAVFGLLAGFGMKFPNAIIQLLIPPIPLKAKYFVLIYGGIELFAGFGSLGSTGGGVAHFAHVGGALFGFLLILFSKNY